MLAPEGPVYQAGTLSGNPVATTAGLTTLRLADDDVYEHLAKVGDAIRTAAAEALDRRRGTARRPERGHHVLGVLHRRRRSATSPTRPARTPLPFAAFFHAMLDRGVYLPPSAYEAWFLSAAHDDARRRDRARRPAGAAARPPRRRRKPRLTRGMVDRAGTIVHLLRHGEVHNPEGSSTAGCPASTSPTSAGAMAERVADTLGDRDITHLRLLAAGAGRRRPRAAGGRPRARRR